MSEGKAFQFAGGQIVEGLGLVDIAADVTHGGVVGSDPPVVSNPPVARVVQLPVSRQQALDTKPLNVIKLARARVREIKSELKRLASLTKELNQLERLLAASKHRK